MALPAPDDAAIENEPELFEQVTEALGLSHLVAVGMVRRALADSGAAFDPPRTAEYLRALPKLAARLKAYAPPAEVSRRIARVRAVVLLWEHRTAAGSLYPAVETISLGDDEP